MPKLKASILKEMKIKASAKAIEILNSWEVDTVVQLHDLSVTLKLNDGAEIYTKEPRIDLIFDEIEKCGETCENIWKITE